MFDCSGMSSLVFEAGAMPMLWELQVIVDAYKWDKALPGGLQHLPCLEKINALFSDFSDWYSPTARDSRKVDNALMRSLLQEAADTLPTRPTFTFDAAVTLYR